MQTVRMDIEQTMTSINAAKDKFVELFGQGNLIQCAAYELPTVVRKEETERPTYIPVTTNKNPDDASKLLREINRWYAREDTFDNNLSTKAAQRLPGFIQVQMNNILFDEFEEVTQQLTKLKEQFKAHLKKIKNADNRFEIIHDMYPMLITTNLYRQIKVFKNPGKVKFSWANKPRIERVDFKQLKKRLEYSKENPQSHIIDTQAWADKVDEEITLIEAIDDKTSLRVKRDSKVQPMVDIDGFQTSCPTPIILVTAHDTPIKVYPLEDYDASHQRQGTGRKAKTYKPVIERLSLYQSMG